MRRFTSFDGVEIRYIDEGTGPPVVLLHGFAASAQMNWQLTGIIDALVAEGFRTVAPDARGHGGSGKPHDPDAYADNAMVRDVSALLDQLSVNAVDVVGYSMGGIVGLGVATYEPRARSLVVGGVGHNLTLRRLDREAIAGTADELARQIRGAAALTVPGDHLSAVAEPALCDAIVEFVARQISAT